MKFPAFTRNDFKIMFGILIPYCILMNSILFGQRLYAGVYVFIFALGTTLFLKCIAWQFHTLVAVQLRIAMPDDAQIMKRVCISLFCFFLMTGLTNTFITMLYRYTGFLGLEYESLRFILVLLSGVVLNIFTTFFYEGASNLEKWKQTLTETEQLKTEYVKSQLGGLKSQIKPHFLFNSINTLSALIAEDVDRAETFLNEMCKVFRYLLRNDAHFTTLESEIDFLRSYFYILKSRYGAAIQLDIDVSDTLYARLLPPFTLQLLLESVLQHNVIGRKYPLLVSLKECEPGRLTLTSSIHSKGMQSQESEDDEPLRNVNAKFRLLKLGSLHVSYTNTSRVVTIPLIEEPNKAILA